MANNTLALLTCWDKGSTQAESMAAAVARIEGYTDIKPQAPLGGRDGKKDILLHKDNITWLCAVYFPNGEQPFKASRNKFTLDLRGLKNSGASGFLFFTNQRLAPAKIGKLESKAKGAPVRIYNLPRIAELLNSALGVGIRHMYLDIALTQEELVSMSAASSAKTQIAIDTNTATLQQLVNRFDQFEVLAKQMGGGTTTSYASLSAQANTVMASGSANAQPNQ